MDGCRLNKVPDADCGRRTNGAKQHNLCCESFAGFVLRQRFGDSTIAERSLLGSRSQQARLPFRYHGAGVRAATQDIYGGTQRAAALGPQGVGICLQTSGARRKVLMDNAGKWDAHRRTLFHTD